MARGLRPSILFFLLFVARAWAQEAQPSEVIGAAGGVAFLSSRTPQNPSKYSQIHWRRTNQLRVASQKRGEESRYPEGPLKGRVELFDNCTLKISHLELEDSNEYNLYLEDDMGKETVEKVLLKVYAPVPKPRVSAITHGDDTRRCNATLSCSVGLDEVTYEWIPPQKLPGKDGPELMVSFDPAVETYVCKVSNPVSSSYASLTYRPPCSWTGEPSTVTSRATPGALVALGHLGLLFLLLLLTVA